MSSMLERLGRPSDDRLLIITAVGLGVSHASTMGVYASLRLGASTSGSVMVPCPWAREAAIRAKGDDIGVELTFLSEHEYYRWGPLTQAPSLLDGDGGFPRTAADLWDHAELGEVRREARAQLERARQWGFEVSHLGSHLDALTLRPEFFDVYLDLAIEHDLPLRLPPTAAEAQMTFPARELAQAAGVPHADLVLDTSGSRTELIDTLRSLPPGVTELVVRPAIDSPELRAYSAGWRTRSEDHVLTTADAEFAQALEGVELIGYRDLNAS